MGPVKAIRMSPLFAGDENGVFPPFSFPFYLKGITAAPYLLNPWDVFNGQNHEQPLF